MNLEEKVNIALKDAMKSKQKDRVDAIRDIRKSIIEFNKSGTGEELTEDAGIKLLNQLAKKRRDAIEMYNKAGRSELSDKEIAELNVIQEFLPEQMSKEDVAMVVRKIIEKVGAKNQSDMGKVMGAAMKELSGKTDGKVVQKIVRDELS